MANARIITVLLALVAGGVGFAIGRVTAPGAGAADGTVLDRSEARPKAPPPVEGDGPALEGAPPAPATDAPRAPRDVLEGVDGNRIDAEVARRAAAIREAARRSAESAEATARARVLAELERERAALADAARGGTLAMLRALEENWTPPFELLGDAERYGALFERKSHGAQIDGRVLDRETRVLDGDTITFPPGRHVLDAGLFQQWSPFPKDLLIVGYGMDETLLVLTDELRIRDDVHSLTFRDLTIHTGDNYLESMRTNPYTLRLDSVRVIGFDMGAGGSDMLSGSVGAFYATDCRIEAGYGRSPGSGNLFDVRGTLLARLEDCVIRGPFRSVYYQWGGAAQVFDHCEFVDMDSGIHMRRHLENPGAMVRFVDCTFEFLPEDAPRRRERRPVTDINPAWGD
ncbi:MAG: hypothetical protein ACYTG6_02395 [Planctomycetota bacterium]|jgi:hypothetical protein